MARRDLDDDAPWLAEAGNSPRTTVSKRSFLWTLLILLGMAAVIAVGLILLLSKKDGGSTQGYMNAEQAPVITAEPGPYKIPPVDPKGMAVEGQDQTIYAAGEGIDQGSVIDQSAMPETPLPRPGSAPPGPPRDLMPGASAGTAAPTALPPSVAPPAANLAVPVIKPVVPRPAPVRIELPKPEVAKPATIVPPKPAPTPAVKKPGTVQLGAFSSAEKANAAWAALAAKHGMGAFSKRVIAIESDGKTLYRLRGSGGDSAEICRKLKAAGDACAVVE